MSKSWLDENLGHKTKIFLSPLIFNFVRKILENLWLIDDHFLTVFGNFFANFMNIFHKTEVKMVILRCLVSWIKSYYTMLVKKDFSMPENTSFQGYFAEVSFVTSEGNQLSYFQNGYFDKILWWSHEPQN